MLQRLRALSRVMSMEGDGEQHDMRLELAHRAASAAQPHDVAPHEAQPRGAQREPPLAVHIAPSVLAADFSRLGEEVAR